MRGAFHLFSFKGIAVSMQPFFLVLIVVLTIGLGDLMSSLIFAACAIIGLLVHEFGHALVARRYGLNPDIVLTAFGGVTRFALSPNARQGFRITLAGPLSGLALAGVSYGAFLLVQMTMGAGFLPAHPPLNTFFRFMIWVNLVWSIFNLIPVMPMDGGKLMAGILAKFLKPARAARAGGVVSIVFSVLLLLYALYSGSMFMIVITGYLLMLNVGMLREIFSSPDRKRDAQKNLQAERIYERGLVAARGHRWEELELLGHQMKQAAVSPDQLGRAYEFLTIACTNLYKYEEALGYARRAPQTDAVKQAAARSERMLNR
ncbi:MAG: M50 family metallopeptidase [Proteobacteria bacterium]|nr:M50 family metallopeptidase [Pseudomonadota bacterium]